MTAAVGNLWQRAMAALAGLWPGRGEGSIRG